MIENYPYQEKRKARGAKNAVVELCVERGIRDVAGYLTRVVRMRGDCELQIIVPRQVRIRKISGAYSESRAS